MNKETNELNLLNAIKKDDVLQFSILIQGRESFCYGRFPVLSICLLYNSKKIISKYRNKLYSIADFTVVSEPFSLYEKFRQVAGRCLRLYQGGNIVMPIELLAIMHKDHQVKKYYKKYAKTSNTKNDLVTIYDLIYNQKIYISDDRIKICSRPFNKVEKKFMIKVSAFSSIFACLFLAIIFVLAFTVGLGTSFCPTKIITAKQLEFALNGGRSYYQLQNDLTINSELSIDKFYGVFDFNNKSLELTYSYRKCMVETNSGTIKNLRLKVGNVAPEIQTSLSFLSYTNEGTIEQVDILCGGDIKQNYLGENYVAGFSVINNGYIRKCNVKANIKYQGVDSFDGYLSGICAINNGNISACEVSENSSFESSLADAAGIAAINSENGAISSCKNYSNLSQSSDKKNWSPNVAGISITNNGEITNCFNYGEIDVSSVYPENDSKYGVYAAGISCVNKNVIRNSINYGKIVANADTLDVYAGGISAISISPSNSVSDYLCIVNCGNESYISALSNGTDSKTYCGGIAGYFVGGMERCFSITEFENSGDSEKNFVGICIGSTQVYSSFFGASLLIYSQNFVGLSQSNVLGVVGIAPSLIYTNDIFLLYDSASQVKASGVYWNEK